MHGDISTLNRVLLVSTPVDINTALLAKHVNDMQLANPDKPRQQEATCNGLGVKQRAFNRMLPSTRKNLGEKTSFH